MAFVAYSRVEGVKTGAHVAGFYGFDIFNNGI
jgi:hypothetical protein